MLNHKAKRPKPYLPLVLATTLLAVNFWAWDLLAPLGADLERELQLDPTMLSLLLATPVVVGALGRIILGALTDRFGGRVMFTITTVLTSIPVFALIFADSLASITMAAIFLGLGGAIFAVGVPYVSAWFRPDKQGLALGVYGIGDAGTALAVFAMPPLVAGFGRSQTFLMLGIILLIAALVFAIWGKNSPAWRPSKASPVRTMALAIKSKVTWDLSLVYAVTFGAFVAFGVYLPILLKVSYDLPMTDAAMRAGGFILLATLARPFGGWLSDIFGGKHVVWISLALVTILASFVAFQPTLALATTIGYLSLAFVLGACSGAVFALVGRAIPAKMIGGATGIIGAVGGLGGFLPPIVLGWTYQQTGSYIYALLLLAVTALIVLIYTHRRFHNTHDYSYKPK